MISYQLGLFLVALLSLVSPVFGTNCPGGIESSATNLICPGGFGTFICTSVNSITMGWTINMEERLVISPDDLPGTFSPTSESGDAVAYLVDRQVASGITGNRTSILRYTPTFSSIESVSIVCNADNDECDTIQVLVYGRDEIDMPTDLSQSVDNGLVTYQWNHPLPHLVRHYELTVDTGLQDQLFQVTASLLRMPVGNVGNPKLVAVSICGHRSEPIVFDGPTVSSLTTTMERLKDGDGSNAAAIALGILFGIAIILLVAVSIALCIVGKPFSRSVVLNCAMKAEQK